MGNSPMVEHVKDPSEEEAINATSIESFSAVDAGNHGQTDSNS